MGVPPNHPFVFLILHYEQASYWGTPMLGNPHILIYDDICVDYP